MAPLILDGRFHSVHFAHEDKGSDLPSQAEPGSKEACRDCRASLHQSWLFGGCGRYMAAGTPSGLWHLRLSQRLSQPREPLGALVPGRCRADPAVPGQSISGQDSLASLGLEPLSQLGKRRAT